MMPVVSVIMPVYNGEAYLREAVDSILGQSFGDFELLIVNDGSGDGSAAIARSYTDPRIRLAENATNLGVVLTLNHGLDLARGQFIARMDSDDRSLPERFARQLAFLDAHPQVGICGTWMESIGDRRGYVWRYPANSERARATLLFESPLAHPSVMMRRDLLERHGLRYSMDYQHAEDYGLWAQAVEYTALANLPAVLVHYRKHAQQTGKIQQRGLQAAANRIRREQIERLGLLPTAAELALHAAISTSQFQPDKQFIVQAAAWLQKLRAANRRAGVFAEPYFSEVLGQRWYWVCRLSTRLGLWAWWAFRRSALGASTKISPLAQLKFVARCVLP